MHQNFASDEINIKNYMNTEIYWYLKINHRIVMKAQGKHTITTKAIYYSNKKKCGRKMKRINILK